MRLSPTGARNGLGDDDSAHQYANEPSLARSVERDHARWLKMVASVDFPDKREH